MKHCALYYGKRRKVMVSDYIYQWQYEKFKTLEHRKFEQKSKLFAREFESAYVVPVEKSCQYMMGTGGVYKMNGEYVDFSAILSCGNTIASEMNNKEYETYLGADDKFRPNDNIKTINEEVVYLGHIYNHWGHFLVDFSTRLWYMLTEGKGKKAIFVVKKGEKFALIDNIKRFIELLGIRLDQIEFVNEATKYKKVIVPDVSYRTNDFYSLEYLNMFEIIASRIESTLSYEKVYFTRNKFRKAIKTEFGEDEIETAFNKAGFVSVSPEKCSLDDQIAMIRNCRFFAGVSGTITHNLLFAKEEQKAIIINKTYIVNVMQFDINTIKKLDVTYVDAFSSPFPVSLGVGPFMLECNTYFCNLMSNYFGVSPDVISEEKKKDKIKKYLRVFEEKFYTDYDQKFYAPENRNSVHFYNTELSSNWSSEYDALYRFFKLKKIKYKGKKSFINRVKHMIH